MKKVGNTLEEKWAEGEMENFKKKKDEDEVD